ncbi:MAG: FAD:protein FMN transferase [Hyphomicrobiales bacterium]
MTMRAGVRSILLLASAVLFAACEPDAGEYRTTLYVFGTLTEIVIAEKDRERAAPALAGIAEGFGRMQRDWNAWKPGEMTDLNAAFAEGRSMAVSPLLADAIETARHLEETSGGLFNPAIGSLIGLWGFHADDLPQGPPPDAGKIAALVAGAPSMADVRVEGAVASSRNPAVQLDFGGFAKGAALDWAAGELASAGIVDAVINAGGGVKVIGRHGARPWRVAIRDPRGWGVIASVELAPGEALHTSGNYNRFLEHDGIVYSHILDPRTGWPVRDIVSASVIHRDGALADGAATALSVAGPGEWPAVAARMGVTDVVLVDGAGTLYLTATMKSRLRIEDGKDHRMVVAGAATVPPAAYSASAGTKQLP